MVIPKTVDVAAALALKGCQRLLRFCAEAPRESSKTGRVLAELGLSVYAHHYYHPFVSRADVPAPLSTPRRLPGLPLDTDAHLDFLRGLSGLSELDDIPDREPAPGEFYFDNGSYDHGDADVLYGIIRSFKPRRIIEIGCGNSTKLVQRALARNRTEDPDAGCRHVCIEPYGVPWLDGYGVEVHRAKVERCDPAMFEELEPNDILFIDSSHVIRPQGDVLFELLEILPGLAPGVFVHVHDIFTPRDYPDEWIFDRGLLWNEQYLLEGFLSMNDGYEVLAPLNWLATSRNAELAALLPAFGRKPTAQPGAFWIRRK